MAFGLPGGPPFRHTTHFLLVLTTGAGVTGTKIGAGVKMGISVVVSLSDRLTGEGVTAAAAGAGVTTTETGAHPHNA